MVIAGQELAERPGAVVAGGHTTLQERCEARGFPFTLLECSSAAWEAAPEPRIVGTMMACSQHLADVAAVLGDHEPDVALVDCLMFGALAAMEDHDTPPAVLVHSAPGLLMASGGEMERFLLGPVNELRERFGRNPVARLWDAWSAFRRSARRSPSSTRWRPRRRRRSTMSGASSPPWPTASRSCACPTPVADQPGIAALISRTTGAASAADRLAQLTR